MKDSNAFSGENLSTISEEAFCSWFPDNQGPPNLHERLNRLHELGSALLSGSAYCIIAILVQFQSSALNFVKDFDGLALTVVKKANGSARELVRLVLMHFVGYFYSFSQHFTINATQCNVLDKGFEIHPSIGADSSTSTSVRKSSWRICGAPSKAA